MKDYYDASAQVHNDRMYWDRDATEGYAEDAVLPPWSEHAYDIMNIVVEDGITTIGDYAFGQGDVSLVQKNGQGKRPSVQKNGQGKRPLVQ